MPCQFTGIGLNYNKSSLAHKFKVKVAFFLINVRIDIGFLVKVTYHMYKSQLNFEV